MNEARPPRLVGTVLRCYPAHWRRRHGDEAAELAVLLIDDGTAAGSIALNYLTGAAREWLTPRQPRRLITLACALLVAACSLGASAGLLTSVVPARAASPTQARGRAHCRPASPAPIRSLLPAMGHVQVTLQEAWRGRSC